MVEKSILVILKEYALSIAYPKVVIDEYDNLNSVYDSLFLSRYDNGKLYLGEDDE